MVSENQPLCEYPLIGGLCGELAVCRGRTTGFPYCENHKNLILRYATEEVSSHYIETKGYGTKPK